ncbi:hypothetical protein [Mariprofundus sp. KV]|uniref:hypothetical protein n=1 Tax=Mariprofundus sp. KV TaxID=2608715 RepID=UPI0015A02A54|nr:hypothetical protein [Mariprofundus sp. KV]NWF36219.1 hypothetical protein [Mariprofundus sp. KV]
MSSDDVGSPQQLISSYWVDRHYTIAKVGADWDKFAIENGGEELVSPQIIGQNLFSYIASDTTRMYLRLILDHVWHIHHQANKPYRCDSPEIKRFMQMQISIDDENLLRLDHYLLATEPNSPPVHFSGIRSQNSNLIRRCSMCNRINVAFSWVDADLALKTGLITDPKQRVIYTVCGDCNNP